ncbi:MAG TPA: ATP-binding protein, partial [Jatrophihabitans sp.]
MPTTPSPLARVGVAAGLPLRWSNKLSLRARLTIVSTVLFSIAVATGSVLVILLARYALTHALDSAAERTASDIAYQFVTLKGSATVLPTSGGVLLVQVVDQSNQVVAASPGADRVTPVLPTDLLQRARDGATLTIAAPPPATGRWRILARPAGEDTVVVATDYSRVDDSQTVLTRATLIGGPIGVLLMALATYTVVALTLRPVAALRHGAADITAAGLADQRLPIPGAQDEIHRLAVTLNAMLDRIDSATTRQRTFVGDAAHELRSPLASLRVQLEVAQRTHTGLTSEELRDVMVDAERLDRLVADLLTLARMDESGGTLRREEPVLLSDLAVQVVGSYLTVPVPVTVRAPRLVEVSGDPDGLQRVIINLVDNAVRHARASVVVAVSVEDVAGRPVAQLTVIDDGPGLPVEERERVFDRFYRLE